MFREFGNPRNGATCSENLVGDCDDVFEECCEDVSYLDYLIIIEVMEIL